MPLKDVMMFLVIALICHCLRCAMATDSTMNGVEMKEYSSSGTYLTVAVSQNSSGHSLMVCAVGSLSEGFVFAPMFSQHSEIKGKFLTAEDIHCANATWHPEDPNVYCQLACVILVADGEEERCILVCQDDPAVTIVHHPVDVVNEFPQSFPFFYILNVSIAKHSLWRMEEVMVFNFSKNMTFSIKMSAPTCHASLSANDTKVTFGFNDTDSCSVGLSISVSSQFSVFDVIQEVFSVKMPNGSISLFPLFLVRNASWGEFCTDRHLFSLALMTGNVASEVTVSRNLTTPSDLFNVSSVSIPLSVRWNDSRIFNNLCAQSNASTSASLSLRVTETLGIFSGTYSLVGRNIQNALGGVWETDFSPATLAELVCAKTADVEIGKLIFTPSTVLNAESAKLSVSDLKFEVQIELKVDASLNHSCLTRSLIASTFVTVHVELTDIDDRHETKFLNSRLSVSLSALPKNTSIFKPLNVIDEYFDMSIWHSGTDSVLPFVRLYIMGDGMIEDANGPSGTLMTVKTFDPKVSVVLDADIALLASILEDSALKVANLSSCSSRLVCSNDGNNELICDVFALPRLPSSPASNQKILTFSSDTNNDTVAEKNTCKSAPLNALHCVVKVTLDVSAFVPLIRYRPMHFVSVGMDIDGEVLPFNATEGKKNVTYLPNKILTKPEACDVKHRVKGVGGKPNESEILQGGKGGSAALWLLIFLGIVGFAIFAAKNETFRSAFTSAFRSGQAPRGNQRYSRLTATYDSSEELY
eukprot:ANDGO_04199.mRNA.1 hypothetical protein